MAIERKVCTICDGSTLDLRHRGIWNNKIQTAASAFAELPQDEQNRVVFSPNAGGVYGRIELLQEISIKVK